MFEEAFAQDEQQAVRESTTYRFYEIGTQKSESNSTNAEPSDEITEEADGSVSATTRGGHRNHAAIIQQPQSNTTPPSSTNGEPAEVTPAMIGGTATATRTSQLRTDVADSLSQEKSPSREDIYGKSPNSSKTQYGMIVGNEQTYSILALHPAAKNGHSSKDTTLLTIGVIVGVMSVMAMIAVLMIGMVQGTHGPAPTWLQQKFWSILQPRKGRRLRQRSPQRGRKRLSSLCTIVVLAAGSLSTSISSVSAAATVPARHTYSGRLLDSSGNAITTARTFRFSYWTSADYLAGDLTGTGAINTSAANYGGWYETQTITPNTQGYVSLELGGSTAIDMASMSVELFTSLYLQVEVKTSGAADTTYELLDTNTSSSTIDRSSVLSVPFSVNADMLDKRDVGTGSGSIPVLQSGDVFSKAIVPGGTNSGSFLLDADDSESSTVTLQFGSSLTKRLSFDIINDRFSFNNDVYIGGSLTTTGSVIVKGSMSGASLRVSGNADIWGSLASSGSISTRGTLSGAVVRSFGLTDCDSATTNKILWDTTTGKFSCGTDQNTPAWSGTGALRSAFDARYIKQSGGTMTGGLTINLTSGTTGLSVQQTISGSILHADTQIRGSGSLAIEGASSFGGSLSFGDTLADVITVHAGTWTFENDTNFSLSGGVNGLSFDASTLSVDALNDRIGIGTTVPDATLEVAGTMSGAGLVIGGGTELTRILSATATLDFPNTLLNACSDLTMTVIGAATGDATTATPDSLIIPVNGIFDSWVSASNTVTVRYCAIGASVNVTSGTYRVQVFKY